MDIHVVRVNRLQVRVTLRYEQRIGNIQNVLQLGDRRIARSRIHPDPQHIARIEPHLKHRHVDHVVERSIHLILGRSREDLIARQGRTLVIDIGNEHGLFGVIPQSGTHSMDQIAAVVGIGQTIQKEIARQFIRTFVSIGVVVRDLVIGQQLYTIRNRFRIGDSTAHVVAARAVHDILIQQRGRIGIQIPGQGVLRIVLIVLRQTSIDRHHQDPTVAAPEFVHIDQTSRKIVSEGVRIIRTPEDIQQSIFHSACH